MRQIKNLKIWKIFLKMWTAIFFFFSLTTRGFKFEPINLWLCSWTYQDETPALSPTRNPQMDIAHRGLLNWYLRQWTTPWASPRDNIILSVSARYSVCERLTSWLNQTDQLTEPDWPVDWTRLTSWLNQTDQLTEPYWPVDWTRLTSWLNQTDQLCVCCLVCACDHCNCLCVTPGKFSV